MQIRKAVITAAGRGVRLFPAADTVQKAMLPFVDRDGINKPLIQIIAEEALESGIEEICVVCAPGDRERYLDRFEQLRENLRAAYKGVDWARRQEERLAALVRRLQFAVQQEPRGYGDAVACAAEFASGEPILLLLGDHLYVSGVAGKRCAAQILELARSEECAVSAVHATPEHLVHRYGTLSGKRLPNCPGAYQIERILEKPSLSQAELEVRMPGLRAGYYLCFFGMHVLTPGLFEILRSQQQASATASGADTQLTPALQELARREKYLALEVNGARFDIVARFGLVKAQLALSLAGNDRDEALTMLVQLLAEIRSGAAGNE